MPNVIGMHLEGFFDQRIALGLVGFGLDQGRQLVHLGIAIGPEVELTSPFVVHATDDGVEHVVSVVGGGGPAQKVEAGVALEDFGKVGAFGFSLQIDLDIDARQSSSHRLTDLAIVHIAVIRTVHTHLKAIGVARLCEELFGRFRIVGQAFVNIGKVAVDAWAHHQGAGAGGSAHHCALDAIDVDRLVKRLAHPLVFEGILALDIGIQQLVTLLVHAQKNGAQLGALHYLVLAAGVDARHVLHRHRLNHIHLTRKQSGNPCGVVANGRELHADHVAFDLAPVGTMAHEAGLDARLPLAQPEGPRPVGTKGRCVLNALATIHRPSGVVLFAPLLAHDVQEGQHFGQDGKRRLGLDVHRVVIDLAHRLDFIGVTAHVRAVSGAARETEQHIVCREGLPIVKRHALAQFESPDSR